MGKKKQISTLTCLVELLILNQLRHEQEIKELKMNINEAMQQLADAKVKMDKVIAEQTTMLASIAALESSLAARDIPLTPAEEQLITDIKNGLTLMDDRVPDAEPVPTEEPAPDPLPEELVPTDDPQPTDDPAPEQVVPELVQ